MRLIDADKLIEIINNSVDENDWLLNQFNADYIESLVEVQPTAYDVDKVIEQLEKCSFDDNSGFRLIHSEETVDIVKAGGVNE